jgi:hypothetical protein
LENSFRILNVHLRKDISSFTYSIDRDMSKMQTHWMGLRADDTLQKEKIIRLEDIAKKLSK